MARDEGTTTTKDTKAALRLARRACVLATAAAVACVVPRIASAQRPDGEPRAHRPWHGRPAFPPERHLNLPPMNYSRSPVPPDLEQRRDGHMTPEERHLLRQHIEEAVRDLYKR